MGDEQLEGEKIHLKVEDAVVEDSASALPEILPDRYEMIAIIGAGQRAVVYLAKERSTEKLVAIKVFRESEKVDAKVSEVDNPDIIGARYVGTADDGSTFVVMDYVRGSTLAQLIEEKEPIGREQVLSLFAEVCDLLKVAHDKGLAHGNLKPSNVMIGENARPRLMDFGINAAAGARSDIDAVGRVMYETITRKPPSDPWRTFAELQFDYDPAIQEVIRKCSVAEPTERYQAISDVRNALEAAKNSPYVVAQKNFVRNHVTIPVALFTIIALLLLLFGWGWLKHLSIGLHRDHKPDTFTIHER